MLHEPMNISIKPQDFLKLFKKHLRYSVEFEDKYNFDEIHQNSDLNKEIVKEHTLINDTLFCFYKSSSYWTPYVTNCFSNYGVSVIDRVLVELALRMDLFNPGISHEYYRIDNMLYRRIELSSQDKAYLKPFEEHFWKPVICVEHENSWKSWTDELVKLIWIDCELRVVISYSHHVEQSLQIANFVAKKVCGLDGDLRVKGELMLIFGKRIPRNGTLCDEEIVDGFQAYRYDFENECFTSINLP